MKNIIPYLILFLLAMVMIIVYSYPSILNLNSLLLSGGGDGIKNYFTYLFYIKNDIGTRFTGMNYPFGEHVVFTDNMPFLAWFVKYLSLYFPFVARYALGIMNGSLFLSLIVAVIYIYKILQIFKVHIWLSIVGSIFIIFFSPQLFKFQGHFGMAYLMYLPMQIYWLMKYDSSIKLKYLILIAISSSIFAFIHVYNLAFSLVLIFSYALAKRIVNYKMPWKRYALLTVPLVLAVMIAGFVFNLFLKLTDPISDRTAYPAGVFGARTNLTDMFLSKITSLGFVFQFVFGKAGGLSEGYVYIGFIAILVLFILIIYLVRFLLIRLTKRKTIVALHPIRAFRVWLLVSVFMLLFGMGVPFVWNLEFFADHISVFRQFRTMGRFSWSFYYLFLIYSIIFISRIYSWMIRKEYVWQAKVMMGFVFIIWSVQLSGYGNYFRINIAKQSPLLFKEFTENDTENWVKWLNSKGYQTYQFQAILALPYFHIGSEKLWLQDNDEGTTMYIGSQLALQTGIPMIDVMMSRTSLSQSFASAQIIDGPFSKKPILDLFTNKSILVLVNTNFPLKPKESEWVNNSQFIGERHGFYIFSVNLAKFLQAEQEIRDLNKAIAIERKETIGLIDHLDSSFYFVNHFDEIPTDLQFAGIGAFLPKTFKIERVIADIKPGLTPKSSHEYQFSIWVKCNQDDYRSPYFIFRQYDEEDNLIDESDVNTKYSTRIINSWFLVDKTLTFKSNMKRLEVLVVGSSRKSYLALDEMVIWPLESIYFYKKNGNLFLNNRPQK